MDSFIGKKRNTEHKSIDNINEQNNIKKKDKSIENKKGNFEIDMNKLIDDCFDNFINDNTNKLFENYNLLKQKFYEIVQN